MADKITVARPYARAAFEEAQAHKVLGPWSNSLQRAAAVVKDSRVQNLLGNPAVTHAELAKFVIDLAGPALENSQRDALAAALQRRLKRQVRLHCETDPSLLGGAVLRAGDLVIDGSVRARLDRIAYELAA